MPFPHELPRRGTPAERNPLPRRDGDDSALEARARHEQGRLERDLERILFRLRRALVPATRERLAERAGSLDRRLTDLRERQLSRSFEKLPEHERRRRIRETATSIVSLEMSGSPVNDERHRVAAAIGALRETIPAPYRPALAAEIANRLWRAAETNRDRLALRPVELMTLETGLLRLASTLRSIREQHGMLPTTFAFLETSARPLAYAILPILDPIYRAAGQKRPICAFVKTFSEPPARADNAEPDPQMRRAEHRVHELRHQIAATAHELETLTRSLRGTDRTDTRDAAARRTDLETTLAHLRTELRDARSYLARLSSGERETVLRRRLEAIDASGGSGPILFVDDLIGSGNTLNGLQRAAREAGVYERAYFFVFLTTADPTRLSSVDVGNLSVGTVLDWSDEPNRPPFACCSAIPALTLTESEAEAWGDLLYEGFSWRRQARLIGHAKTGDPLAPHATPIENRDPTAMRSIRTACRLVGEHASAACLRQFLEG